MVDVIPEVLKELEKNNIMPLSAYQDNRNASLPCITYYEKDNVDAATSDSIGYSDITLCFEIWYKQYASIVSISKTIDNVLKKYLFDRISALEQNVDGLRRKILTYRVTVREIKE